jgi:hypothetical protein
MEDVVKPVEATNKYGLSKKTNVAIAAISAITLICNVQNIISVGIGVSAVLIIALYHVDRQSVIDLKKIVEI